MKVTPGVLIIDDDESVRRTVGAMLRAEFAVWDASSGEEGLRAFETIRPDVVLLDLMLPSMSGLSVLRAIKRTSGHTPVVIMTAFAQVSTAVEAIRIGAADYLEKPFEAEKLIVDLQQIVSNSLRFLPASREGIIGESAALQHVWKLAERFARTDIPILLQGETGTGKGAFARAIHNISKRAQHPFVDLDCSTIPEQLAESELFGYEDGAFTGAGKKKTGRVAFADRGTLFLDEIGVLTLASQSKLLTLIEQQRFLPLGARDGRARQVDVRFISATNVPLRKAIEGGTFREDLYHRLDGMTIELPPLRERGEDVELLATHFLHEERHKYGKHSLEFSAEALDCMRAYSWPGNVRELRRAVNAAVVMADEAITPDDFPAFVTRKLHAAAIAFPQEPNRLDDLTSAFTSGRLNLSQVKEWAGREAEKQIIIELQGRTKATKQDMARMLGIDPKTLRSRLKEISLGNLPPVEKKGNEIPGAGGNSRCSVA